MPPSLRRSYSAGSFGEASCCAMQPQRISADLWQQGFSLVPARLRSRQVSHWSLACSINVKSNHLGTSTRVSVSLYTDMVKTSGVVPRELRG